MGCGCKKKSKNIGKVTPMKEFRKKFDKPKSEVIKLSETDLRNLINKVISRTKK
jgi:hypothetical protein|tara:strand:+ start:883 stop:1044 length:162 start_codon:yes stop_codon:yes gene_type:complete